MKDYSQISDQELKTHILNLTSSGEKIRMNILKQCDEVSAIYAQLLELREEIFRREKAAE